MSESKYKSLEAKGSQWSQWKSFLRRGKGAVVREELKTQEREKYEEQGTDGGKE